MGDFRLKYITNVTKNNIMLSNHKRIPFQGEFENVLVNETIPKGLQRPIQCWHIWEIDESELTSSILGWSKVGADYFFTVLAPIEFNLYAMTSASSNLMLRQYLNVYRNLLVNTNFTPVIVLQTCLYKLGRLNIDSSYTDIKLLYSKLEKFYSEHKADITKFMFMYGDII